MIQADPSGRFVLHVDLGLDRIFVWKFDEQMGVLTPNEPHAVALPAGDGPRHFHFHPNGRWFYSIQEEASTIVLFDYDAATGRLAPRQTISTLPPGFAGTNFCSEILVSADGRFVYAGNRLHDSIGIFSIGPDGVLTSSRGSMDTRELSPQLQLRPHWPIPLLLQSASRQHRRASGWIARPAASSSPAITPPSAILRASSSSISPGWVKSHEERETFRRHQAAWGFQLHPRRPGLIPPQTDQSSTLKPGTRSKSRRFRVATIARFSRAMAAMRRSMRRTLSRRALSCATRAMADSV